MTTKENEEVMLSFLKLTKEGKYAVIEKSSLNYSRINEERDNTVFVEEELHYSIG